MGIKPALGWLGLLLFTTTAQAEGTRELLREPPLSRVRSAIVTPKTKAPAPLTLANASAGRTSLGVVDTILRPRADYDAATHAGVPLDSPIAKERGLDKGLVQMVFEHDRRAAFRVDHERIRRVVRLAAERPANVVAHGVAAPPSADHVDVLDTDDGVIVVDSASTAGGTFTTSDVYAFPRHATLDQRIGSLENLAVSERVRSRIRQALVASEWLVTSNAAK